MHTKSLDVSDIRREINCLRVVAAHGGAAHSTPLWQNDAVRLFEAIPDRHPREGNLPDALFLFFDAVAAFDHPRQRLLLLTTIDSAAEGGPEAQVDAAIARLDALDAFLGARDPSTLRRAAAVPRFSAVMSKAAFLDAVAQVQEAIAAGEVYQAVLSQRWTAALDLDPFDVYRALRVLNPSPYLFYLETREATLLTTQREARADRTLLTASTATITTIMPSDKAAPTCGSETTLPDSTALISVVTRLILPEVSA